MTDETEDIPFEPILDVMMRELPLLAFMEEFLSFLAKEGYGIVSEHQVSQESPWARMTFDPVWWWVQMQGLEQELLHDEVLALVRERERERLEYEDG